MRSVLVQLKGVKSRIEIIYSGATIPVRKCNVTEREMLSFVLTGESKHQKILLLQLLLKSLICPGIIFWHAISQKLPAKIIKVV